MVAWKSGPNSSLGQYTPGGSEATAKAVVGSIARFFDDTVGEGEFIYLPAPAGGCQGGDAVVYDLAPGAPISALLAHDAAGNSGRSVAFASATGAAGQYSWFQVSGIAEVRVVAAAAAGPMYGSATPGSVGSAADAGDQILNARLSTPAGNPKPNKAYAQINRPFVQGQIT